MRAAYRPFLAATALAALFLHLPSQAQTGPGSDFPVTVEKNGGMVVVDVDMPVAATPREAWAVLTDYDRMADFFPNLDSSRVIARAGNRLQVEQTGAVSYGPFSVRFESLREIELFPYSEIRSRAISGSLRKGDAVTRLVPDGAGTRILYHSESLPNAWVPPAIGPRVIADQTRDQFESLRGEIMKRKRQPGRTG